MLDARKATWFNGKVIGFTVTQFWVPIYVLASISSSEKRGLQCRPHREVAVIPSVGPKPSPAQGLSRGWVSSYLPPPSVLLDCVSP